MNGSTPVHRGRLFVLLLALVVASVLCGSLAASAAAASGKSAAPDRPCGVRALGDDHAVVVSWNAPSPRDQVQTYALEYKAMLNPDTDPWKRIEFRAAAPWTRTITGLANFQRYKVRLAAQNTSLVWSAASDQATATPADATLRDLRWSGQTVAGFSADTLTYTVELPFGTTVVPLVTATPNDTLARAVITRASCLPGTTSILVSARRTRDTTVTRTYKVRFTIARRPDTPTGVKAAGDDRSVIVAWDAPSARDQLKMYLLEYKAVMLPDLDPWKRVEITDPSVRTWTLPGLTNLQRYKVRITAQNTALAWSLSSAPAYATPADPTLSDLRVSGQTVAGFSAGTLDYAVVLPYGTSVVPPVTATTNDTLAGTVVTPAPGIPGTTTIVVTSRTTGDTRVTRTYTVSFTLAASITVTFDSKGGQALSPATLGSGETLGSLLPVPNRPDSLFLGWFTDDQTFQQEFLATTPVTADVTLYARWADVAAVSQTEQDSSIAATECPATFAIDVDANGTTTPGDVKAALRLEVADGAEGTPVPELSVTAGVGGMFTVAAIGGYTPGLSYKLTLADAGLTFDGQPESVRTYCFTIAAPPVNKITVDKSVKLIDKSTLSGITLNGKSTSHLSMPLANVGDLSRLDTTVDTCTFRDTSEPLAVGDVVAVYEGTPPDQRTATGDYDDEPVAYVEVTSISTTGTVSGQTADVKDVLFTPDVLPVSRSADTDPTDGSVLTAPVGVMTYTAAEYADLGLDENTVVEKGDFLAFYDGVFPASAENVAFAKITTVTRSDGAYTIAYADATGDDLEKAMDLYASHDTAYHLTEAQTISAEQDIERQAEQSGFAEAAGDYLTSLALKTDAVKKALKKEGLPADIASLTHGGKNGESAETSTSVTARVYTALEHPRPPMNGLGVEVKVTSEITYGDSLRIDVSAKFVEEVRTAVGVSGGAVWKRKWIFPYIADYKMNGSLDLYDYTGVVIDATITTPKDGSTVDVEQQIKDMLAAQTYDAAGVAAQTQRFYDLYGQMLHNQHDYIELYSKELGKPKEGTLDPWHILAYRVTFTFRVQADVNVSLGCAFHYEKGTRYTIAIRLFARTATSDETDLVDENYSLEFWVMGELGLRVGVVSSFEIGLFSCRAASVGIQIETGPYARLWGYFYYHLVHAPNVNVSQASGALYSEIGIYLNIKFLAQALDKYSFNPTLYDHEFPLWDTGSQQNVYDFAYTLTDATDDIHLKGTTTSCTLPAAMFSMKRVDLKTGDVAVVPYASKDFTISFTNGNFSQTNGVMTVQKPVGQDITEGSMTVSWKGGPLSFTTVPLSRTYHVVWDDLKSSYLLSFDSQGGSLASPISGAAGTQVTLPQPTRAGYDFGGWCTDAAGTSPFTATTMPAANTQLYAKWSARNDTAYRVQRYMQALDGSYSLAATVPGQGTTATSVTPTVIGYTGFTSPSAETTTIAGDGSTVVQYFYPRKSYTLTFVSGVGDPESRTVLFQGDATPPNVLRAGYAFAGWFEAGEAAPWTVTTMPARDVTLTASWTPIPASYTVKHYQQTVDLSTYALAESTTTIVTVGAVVRPPVNTYTGFGRPSPQTVTVAGDGSTVVRYYYQRISFTLTFVFEDGLTDPQTKSVAFDATIPFPTPEPTWAGHHFDGWYEDGASQTYAGTKMPDAPLTLYARWSVPTTKYTVTHSLEKLDGSGYETASTEETSGPIGGQVTPAVKTYEGFTSPPAQTVTIVSSDKPLIDYRYLRNSYTLTFEPGNGGAPTAASVTFGADTTPYAPTVEWSSHTFTGWYSDSGLTTPYTFGPMPAGPVTVYAGWTSPVHVGTQLSTGINGSVTVGSSVRDTITLTWAAPPGVVPTGIVRVTMLTPGGAETTICDQALTATTSPYSFTTADTQLNEVGVYQFKAEYIPDGSSLFAGAVSGYADEQVTTTAGWTETTDVPADMPGMALPASHVAGMLAAGDLADMYTITLGPGDHVVMTLGPTVDMWFAQLELRKANGTFISETEYSEEVRVIEYTVPFGTPQATYQVRMEHLTNTAIARAYSFDCAITTNPGWTEITDVPADMPGVALPAAYVSGALTAGDLADMYTITLGPGDHVVMTLGSSVNTYYAQLELRQADGTFIDETDYYPSNRVIDYTVPLETPQATYMVRMEHLTDTAVPAAYDFLVTQMN